MPSKSTILICPNSKCKQDINKPILLTDLSKTPPESYYACPRCMARLDTFDEAENVPDLVPVTAEETPKPEETLEPAEAPEPVEPQQTEETPPKTPEAPKPAESKEDTPTGCPHHFGYLSKRPKDKPIPEECLTCRKMVQCMLNV